MIDVILKISDWFDKLKAIKFQGKPVNIEPLKNSKTPNNKENIKKELIVFFDLKTIKKYEVNPKNILKKAGIKNIVIGIKNLKFSSKVKEIEIQYKLEIK